MVKVLVPSRDLIPKGPVEIFSGHSQKILDEVEITAINYENLDGSL